MTDSDAMTEAEVATILTQAGLQPPPDRRRHLATALPRFRARCLRLYEVDVEGVEFDFLHPLR